MNLTTTTEPFVALGESAKLGEIITQPKTHPYPWIIGGAAGVLGLGLIFFLTRKPAVEKPLRARDVFKMPGDVDGFAVVALLRRLSKSELVKLKDNQRQELQCDVKRIEQSFGASNAMPDADLRSITSKWLSRAT
jgi:hypothetical protein